MIVVTKVEGTGGAPLGAAPILQAVGNECVWWTLTAASLKFGLTRNNLRVILHRYMELFDCGTYRQVLGSRWPERLLSPADMHQLEMIRPTILLTRAQITK